MKVVLAIVIIFSGNLFAENFSAQFQAVLEVSKSERISSYKAGYVNVVSTQPMLVNLQMLKEHYGNSSTFEETLSQEQYVSLFRCVNGANCNLWSFQIASDYMGGTGILLYFVPVNRTSNKVAGLLRQEIFSD